MPSSPRGPSRAWGLDLLLVLSLTAGLVCAACGGAGGAGAGGAAAGPTAGPGAPAESASVASPGSPPGSSSPAGSAPSAAAVAPSTTSAAPTVTPSLAEMKAPIPSAVQADLVALGLDPKNLPPIEKLEPRALRGVMKVMARSLGIKCGDCHVEGDFGAPTRRKKIAARMWDEFAAKLTSADGSPLFCDSCHQGRTKLLDRSDKKALGKWMQASFVDGLHRKDGQPEACESCHVGWDMTFLSSWGR